MINIQLEIMLDKVINQYCMKVQNVKVNRMLVFWRI